MIDLEGSLASITIYCLGTVGSVNMISEAGNSLALISDNVNIYVDLLALFQLASGTECSGKYLSSQNIASVYPFAKKVLTQSSWSYRNFNLSVLVDE